MELKVINFTKFKSPTFLCYIQVSRRLLACAWEQLFENDLLWFGLGSINNSSLSSFVEWISRNSFHPKKKDELWLQWNALIFPFLNIYESSVLIKSKHWSNWKSLSDFSIRSKGDSKPKSVFELYWNHPPCIHHHPFQHSVWTKLH